MKNDEAGDDEAKREHERRSNQGKERRSGPVTEGQAQSFFRADIIRSVHFKGILFPSLVFLVAPRSFYWHLIIHRN
jgi:hypothetical protein